MSFFWQGLICFCHCHEKLGQKEKIENRKQKTGKKSSRQVKALSEEAESLRLTAVWFSCAVSWLCRLILCH